MGRDVDIYDGFDEFLPHNSIEDMLDMDFPINYGNLEDFDDYVENSTDNY